MKRNMTTILLFVVLFVGLALLLYPSVSDFYNSFHQCRSHLQHGGGAGVQEGLRGGLGGGKRL